MSEKLKDLVGPNTLKRAKKTKHYKLASILGEIMYLGRIDGDDYRTPAKQYVGDECAKVIPNGNDCRPGHVNVDRALREIRDHLETLAFREAIE